MNPAILLKKILGCVVRCTPKWYICVLRGYPSFEDNLVAIYHELLRRGITRIVWVVDSLDEVRPFRVDPATQFVVRGSWRDFGYSVLAKYLFITHGHFIDKIPSNQICTNLWHGIPYKVIGKLDGKQGREDTVVVATSALTREIFAKSFGIDAGRIAITGQARTDRLFVENSRALKQQILPDSGAATKIFLWLPTYRTTDLGGGRSDGKDHGNLFNCSDFSVDAFNTYLAANDAVCFVKPHPMARRQDSVKESNLIYIDEHWLHARRTTLYQFAGIADCLISDISSIIIDFMLVDRPIVLLFEDIADYETTRGFSFSPIGDWLPAPVNRDFSGFIADIDAVVRGIDRYAVKRNALKSQFFTHADNGSAARIFDHVFGSISRTPDDQAWPVQKLLL